jgi:hypothetical protein
MANDNKERARLIVAEEKENGHYRFREQMVPLDEVQDRIEDAKR